MSATVVHCEVNDYIEVWAYQTSGGALSLQGDATTFGAAMIAAELA